MSGVVVLTPEELEELVSQAVAKGVEQAMAAVPAPEPDELDRLVSLDRAAGILGVSRRQVNYLASKGQLAVAHIGRSAYVSRRELSRYVAEREREADTLREVAAS